MAVTDWSEWQPQERAVLVFLRREGELLLIHKKRGLGAGKVNGPGGRLEPGESAEQAARRETLEETGVTVDRLEAAADLRFQFTSGYALSARVFMADGFSGTLTACDEADPFWHPSSALPWSQMWADDAVWLPEVLEGRFVDAWFVFEDETMREARLVVRQRPSLPIRG